MTEPVTLADADVLPIREILIRDAIKNILKKEPMLSDVKAWHNVQTTLKGFGMPYGYVMFLSRSNIDKGNDISNFYYAYNFQIGVVVELKSTEEDDLDNLALKYINLVESALIKNSKLDNNVERYYYPTMKVSEPLAGMLPNIRHLSLKIAYTAYVPYTT